MRHSQQGKKHSGDINPSQKKSNTNKTKCQGTDNQRTLINQRRRTASSCIACFFFFFFKYIMNDDLDKFHFDLWI